MTQTTHVELSGPRDCTELIEYLRSCGLEGTLVETNDRCELEVGYAVDPAQRLHEEVWAALRSWLSERDSPLVLAAVGEGEYVLRPPGE